MDNLVKVTEDEEGKKFVQTSSPFLTLVTCEWNPKFTTRREEVDYEIENKPYIEVRAEIGLEENVETCAEPNEDESIVRTFMRGRHESDVRADRVEAFCFGANLELLQAEKGKCSETAVAWLDERSFEAGKSRSRVKPGPLTASGLYKELKKPVSQTYMLILTHVQPREERWSWKLTQTDSMVLAALLPW
jgi:hypothetical protein